MSNWLAKVVSSIREADNDSSRIVKMMMPDKNIKDSVTRYDAPFEPVWPYSEHELLKLRSWA